MSETQRAIRVHLSDNVAVAIKTLAQGESLEIDQQVLTLQDDIPAGHKFALQDFKPEAEIIKYGFCIGRAKTEINQGSWVHEHNIHTALVGKFTSEPELKPANIKPSAWLEGKTFQGYRRASGEVGIRNEIWGHPYSRLHQRQR